MSNNEMKIAYSVTGQSSLVTKHLCNIELFVTPVMCYIVQSEEGVSVHPPEINF